MRQIEKLAKWQIKQYFKTVLLVCTSIISISCSSNAQNDLQKTISTDALESKKLIKVDVETATLDNLASAQQYKGTTQPKRQVSWRSQTEGILLELSAEVGNSVGRGQLIGKLENKILQTDLEGKVGELAALQSELAQAKIQVTNAQIKLEEAKIQLEQATSEAIRYQDLAKTGLIAQQQAESFKTAAKIAEKSLLTAKEAVKLEEQAVAIVEGRITTQRSGIVESKQRQAFSQIIAPISGIVMTQPKDVGSLISIGEEVVTIGDFSEIKVVVPLSELDLGKVKIGQKVEVKLDAFGDRQFTGKVSRIAPTTNSSSRQIPVEVVVKNSNNQIKGGLLARVKFSSTQESRIIVPETAIMNEGDANYVFIVAKEDTNNQSQVTKRKVIIGSRTNKKVEIVSGISLGEKYVIRSSRPLKDNSLVGLSILSQ